MLSQLFSKPLPHFLRVSFHRLDPGSRMLIVYNGENPLRNIRFEVKDEYGDKFTAHIPHLEPNQEFLLSMDSIIDERGNQIESIRSIRAIIDKHKEYFRLSGKEFHRA